MITQEHLQAPGSCDWLQLLSYPFAIPTLSTQKPSSQTSAEYFMLGTHTSPPECLFCCILQGINLPPMPKCAWDSYYPAATSSCCTFALHFMLLNHFCDEGFGHRFLSLLQVQWGPSPPVYRPPSLTSHIAPCQWIPGTWKKPFGPYDIWFKQAGSRVSL